MISLTWTNQASLTHGVKCMVYGPSGVGKTRLLASAPKPVIISAEKGLLSLRQFQLPAIEIQSYVDLEAALQYLYANPLGREAQTICLDSVSEIAEVCLADAKAKKKDGRAAHGDMQDDLAKTFRRFRDIPGKHVCFTAKEEFTKDADGRMLRMPMFPGNKLAQNAPYFFDEVFQLCAFRDAANRQTRWLRTAMDNQNVAKDRSGVLSEWENADPATGGGLTVVFEKMMKG